MSEVDLRARIYGTCQNLSKEAFLQVPVYYVQQSNIRTQSYKQKAMV